MEPVKLEHKFASHAPDAGGHVKHRFQCETVAVVLHEYEAREDDELSILKGEKLYIINKFPDEWYLVQNSRGSLGVVPANHLQESVSTSMEIKQAAPAANAHLHEPGQSRAPAQTTHAPRCNGRGLVMSSGNGPPATPRSASRSLNRSSISEGSPKRHPFGFHVQQQKNLDDHVHLQQVPGKQGAQGQAPRERLIEEQTPHMSRRAPRGQENILDSIFALPGAIFGPIFEGASDGNCACFKIGGDSGILAQRRMSPAKQPLSARGNPPSYPGPGRYR